MTTSFVYGGSSDRVGDLVVDGTRIRYAITGDHDDFQSPTLLLVHGAGAHRLWWMSVVPTLAQDHRVVTLDLSGHGDSDWRENYGPSVFAREIVAAAYLVEGPVVLVGHSMGGRACVVAAAMTPQKICGVVVLDSLFPVPGSRPERRDADRRVGSYDDEQTARDRFRLVPSQPHPDGDELRPITDYALTVRDGRWYWKFDPRALWRFQDQLVEDALTQLRCSVTYVFGGRSRVPSRDAAERVSCQVPSAEIREIPEGYHHLPLDSPHEVVDAIRRTLEGVDAST